MTNVKEDIQLIDYLNENKELKDKLKVMIDESIKEETELQEKEEKEDEPDVPDPKEVPSFTPEDVKSYIAEEVKKAFKIKRKVPSKGKIVDKEDIQKEPATETKRSIATKDWFEQLV